MSDSDENSNSDETGNNGKGSFSFSKSAIADLPSTAVQSLHIDSQGLTEYDDTHFMWKDHKKVMPQKSSCKDEAEEPLFDPRTSKLSESISKLKNRRMSKSKLKLPPEGESRADSKTKLNPRRVATQTKVVVKEQPQRGQQPQKRASQTKFTEKRRTISKLRQDHGH